MSDSEDDFMSDAFLAKVTTEATPKVGSSTTYQERRRRAAASSQARADANRIRPLREREEEARQEGLRKNLVEDELRKRDAGGEVGVGMKMMLKMGYQGGDRLGRQDAAPSRTDASASSGARPGEAVPSAEDIEEDDEVDGARGGLGSRKRLKLDVPTLEATSAQQLELSSHKPKAVVGHLFEPLAISIWAGRKGLGARAMAAKATRAPPPAKIAPLDTAVYRSRASEGYAEKKAEGQLRNAQKTVLSLDARDDKGFSILHLSPTDASTFPPPLLDALSLIAPDIEPAPNDDQTQAQRLKSQMEADALAPLAAGGLGDEDDEDEVGRQAGLDGLQMFRETARQRAADARAVDDSEQGREATASDAEDWVLLAVEARKLLQLPASQRLPLTLQYLRDEYHYCLFCGCAYESQESLAAECPGFTEEDHD